VDVKLKKDYEIYGKNYNEGDVIPINKDTGKRLVKLGVAKRIESVIDDWVKNRSQFYE